METLESSRVCRLCGQHSGICINIFDKNENHVKKINAVLPILVHEMDLLPKQMCHRCSYKLEEFHKFYSDCLKTDMDLKSQLSWMRKREVKERIGVPMVQIENVRIKSEPPDYDIYELDPIVENVNYISSMSSMTFSMNSVRNNNEVDSCRINDVNERLTGECRFPDCGHCKCNYGKRDSTRDAALPINCTNIRPKHEVGTDSSGVELGGSSRLNTFQNGSGGKGTSKGSRQTRQRLSKEINGLNIGNILDTNEVQEIKIKTEKPDGVEIRSLRPRKKSVDYLGTKRKKSSLIINPASLSRSAVVGRKSTTKQALDPVVNGIVISQIKKEPIEEIQRRILRPRKIFVDYLGSKRKKISRAGTDLENRSGNEEAPSKRRKSSNEFKETSSFGSGKRFTGLIANPVKIKVKEEIISDDEATNVEQNDETKYNGIVDGCVKNLSNLLDRETELAIKLEENIEDGFADRDWRATAAGSRSNQGSKALTTLNTGKLKPRKRGARVICRLTCSPKYLRSQDLRLRNGKVKKSESNEELSVRNLKKRFLELAETGRALGRNLEKKIKENASVMKVPTSLKTSNNIKHYCEKCCASFMNKELYMLHVCYFD